MWFFVQSIVLYEHNGYIKDYHFYIHKLNCFCRLRLLRSPPASHRRLPMCSPSRSCRCGPRCMIIAWPSVFDRFRVKHDHEFQILFHHFSLYQRDVTLKFSQICQGQSEKPAAGKACSKSCFIEGHVNVSEFVMEQKPQIHTMLWQFAEY